MRIGLIGAPGSGKSKLAEAIRDTYGYPVIDDYVAAVEHHSGWVLGKYGTYAGNLAVALDRRFREQELADEAFITCGTILDTLTYEAARPVVAPDDVDHRRWSSALLVLGCMAEDFLDYDLIFLVASEPEDRYTAAIAQGLEEAVDIFAVEYTLLDQPTIEDRVAAVFAAMREVRVEAASAE